MFYFVITVLVVTVLVAQFFYIRRVLKNHLESKVATKELKEEIEGIIRELNQATERNILILENEFKKVDSSLLEIQKKESLFQKEKESAQRAQKAYSQLRESKKIVPPKKEEESNALTLEEAEKNSQRIREEVISLHKEGIESSLIASRLNVERGEVDLIISLEG